MKDRLAHGAGGGIFAGWGARDIVLAKKLMWGMGRR